MKTMGKIITGVLIVSVIFMYIKNTKKHTITKDICTQTESTDSGQQLEIIEENESIDESIDEENESIDEENDLDDYIQNEVSQIEEVENLSSPVSQDNELTRMSVIELKERARVQQIKGYSKLKKAELIEILS